MSKKEETTNSVGGEKSSPDGDSDYSSDEGYSSSDQEDDLDDDERELMTPEEIEAFKQKREEARAERQARKEEENAKRDAEENEEDLTEEELWNFPPDREHWTEEDLGEVWCDAPEETEPVGWDPEEVDSDEEDRLNQLKAEGEEIPDAPFYMPYHKYYPSIPDNNYDVQTPEDAVEELERIEEFLEWVSYVFEDGSSYEGTVWDDLAHGKGVYVTPLDLCRYEGEWVSNMMEGHGVLEVDVPVEEPPPDSEEALQLKEEGAILKSDYMDPFDREWLKMDLEDASKKYKGHADSFEDLAIWEEAFEEKPEKGRYKYSGEWKHSRFHGCGVYELNGEMLWGKFYFGELLPDPEDCTLEKAEFHSGLAEVAAAKARMFINKPDGMVREIKGPYTDPSHPYMYEEEDLWMAPGFINGYYEVPKEWQVYVEDLDKERQMWLNSFTKAPFVVPMPPEMEYFWSQDDEFVVLGNTPTAMLSHNPENEIRAEDDLQGEVLLHVPSGRIINWVNDRNGHLRFFLQPISKDGEFNPKAAVPLPLGFDDYFKDETDVSAKAVTKKKNIFERVREAWHKSKEETEIEKLKKKEELENKWKQEDEAWEVQQKLKAMERDLLDEIEEEKILARCRDVLEKAAAENKAERVDQGQGEVVSQKEQLEDGAKEVTTKEVEGDENKVDAERELNGSGEDDQEEDGKPTSFGKVVSEPGDDDPEENGKPTSFGKVAMIDADDSYSSKLNELQRRGPYFPTAFASLSLGHKIVVDEVLKVSFCKAMASLHFKTHSQAQKETYEQPKNLVRIALKRGKSLGDIKLKVSCVSHLDAHSRRAKGRQDNSYVGSARRRHSRCAVRPGTRVPASRQGGTESVWSKPKFGFMSMAIPIEMEV